MKATDIQPNRDPELANPEVFQDGDSWCALDGENMQSGFSGFGNTPEGAIAAFDAERSKYR